jgi:hypothetical protein
LAYQTNVGIHASRQACYRSDASSNANKQRNQFIADGALVRSRRLVSFLAFK